jgi:serine/threonine protein kinase
MNPQDGGSASSSPKEILSRKTPLKKSPSTPSLTSISDGLKKSSSRLAFPAPITHSNSSTCLHMSGDIPIEDIAEDEDDLWWGSSKRGNIQIMPESYAGAQPDPKPEQNDVPRNVTIDLETIILNLKTSSINWIRNSEAEIQRRYRFDRKVGSGLTADVFAGRAPNGTHVALKAYKNLGAVWCWVDQPQALDAHELRDPILRGIRHLLSECSCLEQMKSKVGRTSAKLGLCEDLVQNVGVNVVEVVMTESYTYLIQQFGGDLTLYDIMNQCQGNEPFAKNVIKQVLMNVHICHESGVVHRDIKPENIIVSYENEPWEEDLRRNLSPTSCAPSKSASNFRELLDLDEDLDEAISSCFHASRQFSPQSKLLPITRLVDFGLGVTLNKDQAGNYSKLSGACGTPLYAAPEVLNSSANGSREYAAESLYDGMKADMYSVGVILYALLCGQLPYKANSLHELQNITRSGNIDFPSYISQPARKLIQGLMCVDANARLSTGEALKHTWLEGSSLPAAIPAPALVEDSFSSSESHDDIEEDGGGMWYC